VFIKGFYCYRGINGYRKRTWRLWTYRDMKENYKDSTVKIIPLGGLGAIGKNIMLLEQGDDIIIIDCGIMFPRDEMPGIDYIIPDLSYVRRNKSKVKGIILTHGHEDHIGAISFLLQEVQAPIYATKLP
jgi:ribonuclease J